MSSDWQTIILGGRAVPARMRRSRRVRRIGLRVGPEGLKVSLPAHLPAAEADRFIAQNTAWILKQMDKMVRRRAEAEIRVDGHRGILFRGEETAVKRVPALKRVAFQDGAIHVSSALAEPHRALDAWMRGECRKALIEPVEAAQRRVGKRHGKLVIRDQKTRWGSCSASGTVSFNWRLIMAPDEVLDYVACHEVMHLAVPNHSREFWDGLRDICAATDSARQWLKDHQHRLMIDLRGLFDEAPPALIPGRPSAHNAAS